MYRYLILYGSPMPGSLSFPSQISDRSLQLPRLFNKINLSQSTGLSLPEEMMSSQTDENVDEHLWFVVKYMHLYVIY